MRKLIAICLIALCVMSAQAQERREELPVFKRFDFCRWCCERPDMSILDQVKVKVAGGIQTFQISCDMPESTTDDLLVLDVAFVQYRDFNATMETPSGWTGSDVTSVPNGIARYYRTGGNTTPATINFTGNDVCAVAICYTVSNQKSSSPFTFGSSHSSGGFSHVFTALQSAPYPGAVFVGAVTSPDSNTQFDVTGGTELASYGGGMTKLGIYPYVTGGANPISIAYTIAANAGDSASVTFASRSAYNPTSKAANCIGVGFWISPSQAPSAPVFIAPTTGQQFAVGREITARWNASTDPNVLASLLTYDLEYTLNGITWIPLDTTGAGETSYPWDTTGLSPSATVQLRARASNGTDDGPWGYSQIFTLLADSAPGAPQGVTPTGIVNQQEDLTVRWTFNDPGDLQLALEIQWSTSSTMSSPSTTGTITQSEGEYTFAAATDILASAVPIYYRVRNRGLVDNADGAWSAIKQILVTAPISAPNITFPTNASPPVSGVVTSTFTGTGHVEIKYSIDREGVPVYFSPDIVTSGNSFLIDFDFDDDTNYTLHLQRAASDGLWSVEDSETFFVSYDGPDDFDLFATVVDEAGYIQLSAINPDSPAYLDLYANDVRIATDLPPNFVFNYAGAVSGEETVFRARAFKPVTFGHTDSPEITATQNLQGLFLFKPTKELTTANFVSAPIQVMNESNEPEIVNDVELVRLRYRPLPVAHFRRGSHRVLNYSVYCPAPQISVANQLETWLQNGATICARDSFETKVFGNLTDLDVADYLASIRTPLLITENSESEEVT